MLRRHLVGLKGERGANAILLAFSMVLLLGAGLFIRSVFSAQDMEIGFDARDGAIAWVFGGISGLEGESLELMIQALVDRAEADGEILIRQGEVGDAMFVIQQGQAEILVENGEPILGVIQNPAADVTVWASKGDGTFRHESLGPVGRRELRVAAADETLPKTGQEVARKHYEGKRIFYYPLDFSFSTRRVLEAVRPRAVILMELEIRKKLWFLRFGTGIPTRKDLHIIRVVIILGI